LLVNLAVGIFIFHSPSNPREWSPPETLVEVEVEVAGCAGNFFTVVGNGLAICCACCTVEEEAAGFAGCEGEGVGEATGFAGWEGEGVEEATGCEGVGFAVCRDEGKGEAADFAGCS
jgi:hypothetical protein